MLVPSGVKDILCKESEKKDKLISKLKKLYRSYGYRKIETPIFEYYDTFFEIKNTVKKDKTVKMIDNCGSILVLRPDATTPIVRTVLSNYKEQTGYLKFYYDTNIYRGQSKKIEQSQVGIEYISKCNEFCDSEIITLAIKSLVDISEFQIDIGQTGYLSSILSGIKNSNKIKKAIANKNIIQIKELLKDMDICELQKEAILNVPYLYGKMEDIQDKIICINKDGENAIKSLKSMYEILKMQGYEKYISFDLGLSQDLDYYDGIVFRGYVRGLGSPILSGGRYNNLTDNNDNEFSGIGFGINVDSLVNVSNVIVSLESDYIVCGSDVQKILIKSNELRQQGYIVESVLNSNKIENSNCMVINIDE